MPFDQFDRGRSTAQKTAQLQAEFICRNLDKIQRAKNGVKMADAAEDMKRRLDRGEELTPKQYSYLDNIYTAKSVMVGGTLVCEKRAMSGSINSYYADAREWVKVNSPE